MEHDKKKISLKYSLLDGIFASAMLGFIQDYFTPFILVLGAAARHVGMLNALPNISSALIQLKSPDWVEKTQSRRVIINRFVLLQALTLLPIAVFAWYGRIKPVWFIGSAILFTSFGAVATPAWSSLMSDLVEKERRGGYFGWRTRILGYVVICATFIAGFILQKMKNINVFTGFAVIFGCAFIFRIIPGIE